MSDTDRRHSPRLEIAGNLRVALVPPLWPIHLADVSWGGFLVASSHPFPGDTVLTFEFTDVGGSWVTQLQASVVHTHPRTVRDSQATEHVTGFRFDALDQAGVVEAVDRLLDYAMGSMTIDWETTDRHEVRR